MKPDDYYAKGIVNENELPLLGSDSTQILPP